MRLVVLPGGTVPPAPSGNDAGDQAEEGGEAATDRGGTGEDVAEEGARRGDGDKRRELPAVIPQEPSDEQEAER